MYRRLHCSIRTTAWAACRKISPLWKPPVLPERPIDVMIEANTGDSCPTATTAGARWKTESDIPDHVYFRALEAID